MSSKARYANILSMTTVLSYPLADKPGIGSDAAAAQATNANATKRRLQAERDKRSSRRAGIPTLMSAM